MNERIQKLAEQAEQFADDTMNADPAKYDKPGQVKVWRELMQGKFAELIVRECIAQCEKNVDHEYLGCGSKLSAFNIKQHFGVEE